MGEKGLFVWGSKMAEKSSLDWYVSKAKPKNEWFYDRSLGSKLLGVYAGVYRWQDERSKMCDEGMEATVQHLILYCKRYEGEKGDAGCSYE